MFCISFLLDFHSNWPLFFIDFRSFWPLIFEKPYIPLGPIFFGVLNLSTENLVKHPSPPPSSGSRYVKDYNRPFISSSNESERMEWEVYNLTLIAINHNLWFVSSAAAYVMVLKLLCYFHFMLYLFDVLIVPLNYQHQILAPICVSVGLYLYHYIVILSIKVSRSAGN